MPIMPTPEEYWKSEAENWESLFMAQRAASARLRNQVNQLTTERNEQKEERKRLVGAQAGRTLRDEQTILKLRFDLALARTRAEEWKAKLQTAGERNKAKSPWSTLQDEVLINTTSFKASDEVLRLYYGDSPKKKASLDPLLTRDPPATPKADKADLDALRDEVKGVAELVHRLDHDLFTADTIKETARANRDVGRLAARVQRLERGQ